MSGPQLKRRRLVAAGAVAAVGGTAVWRALRSYARGEPLPDCAAARAIGARYADRYPSATRELWQGHPPKSEKEWVARLRQMSRADFEADRLVEVDGFWLAETELRLCVFLHAAESAG